MTDATSHRKPVLLLDVDGVLLLQNRTRNARLRVANIGYATWFDPEQSDRLDELCDRFDVIWCTGWGTMANQIVGPLFGMPDLPVLSLKMPKDWIPRQFYTGENDEQAITMNRMMNWKLPAVEEHFKGSSVPIAWLDDQIGQPDVRHWAEDRPNTLLVQTVEHIGLDERHMRELRNFEYKHQQLPPPTPLRSRLAQ